MSYLKRLSHILFKTNLPKTLFVVIIALRLGVLITTLFMMLMKRILELNMC